MLKIKIPTLEEDTLKGLDRDQLVNIGLEQNALLLEQAKVINDLLLQVKELRTQVAALQKDSTNSSKPPSTDLTRNRSSNRKHLNSRKASGRKSGGQPGHRGSTREMDASPDKIVAHAPEHCENCGKSLTERGATEQILARSQIVDIQPIVPVVTEHQALARTGNCGHTTKGFLPHEAGAIGTVQIGQNASSFLVYLNTAHHIPYARLEQVSNDLFNFPLSQGTIDNKLEAAALTAQPLRQAIVEFLHNSLWVGSDETGVRVAGKRIWEWVWQNTKASLYAISHSRDYQTVKDTFGEDYQGVLVHDCYCAQNNTVASGHQLCHAHLLRDLQFILENEPSSKPWAYRLQQMLLHSQRARDHIWGEGFNSDIRDQMQTYYKHQLEQFIKEPLTSKAAIRLQKRFKKHQEKILFFMSSPDIPPDNTGSERAIRMAKIKQKVSGGYRSERGAERQALLLSIIETAKKQGLDVLETIQKLVTGQELVLLRG
jgi:transposase